VISAPSRLVVVLSERISEWIEKGEVVDRYYNPGDLFDEVELVLLNDDDPDPAAVQRLVGRAAWSIARFPMPDRFFYLTGGLRPALVRRFARPAVEHVLSRQPGLIRLHGCDVNGVVAAEVRRRAPIPVVMSLHTNPGENRRFALAGWRRHPKEAALALAWSSVQRAGVRGADCVVCVYRYIVPWARAGGAKRIEVIPNAVAGDHAQVKADYRLGTPPRVVLPGRQTAGKDPTPVLDAVARLDGVELVLVGDGELHERLKAHASALGVNGRVQFHPRIPNADLMRLIPECDILVSVNDYGGVSKVELEGALSAMPIVTNAHPLEQEPELLGDACVAVRGDARSYEEAIAALLADEHRRADLGRRVRARAQAEASPERSEQAVVELYRELLGAAPPR
jgi:glycosyltransferase involved in cell wall biosynthesis